MFQYIIPKRDKGINGDNLGFIPFPKSAGAGGIKGINTYRFIPLSPYPVRGGVFDA